MATTIFLVRHAVHDRVDRILCGRMEGVGLALAGRNQAAALGERLRHAAIDAVYSSPMQRARETAGYLDPAPRISDAMTEIDYGAWTGRAFASFGDDAEWSHWNTARSTARPPGGESMAEVRDRALAGIAALRERHPEGRIVVVSHGDVIKSVLMAWLRMPLDAWSCFEISPASISTFVAWPDGDTIGGKVLGMNEMVST